MRGTGGDLLGRAAEHRRVAALQPHHAPTGQSRGDDQLVDRALVLGMAARALADADPFGAGGDQVEHPRPDQRVVEDQVGRGDQPFRLAGKQVGVAGTGADQPDGAGGDEIMRHGRHLFGRI